MSTVDQRGFKIILQRLSAAETWDELKGEYAGTDRQRWLNLAIFALHHQAHWTLEQIGVTFGYTAGHLSRIVHETRRELEDFINGQPGRETADSGEED